MPSSLWRPKLLLDAILRIFLGSSLSAGEVRLWGWPLEKSRQRPPVLGAKHTWLLLSLYIASFYVPGLLSNEILWRSYLFLGNSSKFEPLFYSTKILKLKKVFFKGSYFRIYNLLPPILVKCTVDRVSLYIGDSCPLCWPVAVITVNRRSQLADVICVTTHSSSEICFSG